MKLVTVELHSKLVHLSCFDVDYVHVMAARFLLCKKKVKQGFSQIVLPFLDLILKKAFCNKKMETDGNITECIQALAWEVSVQGNCGCVMCVCDAHRESRLHRLSLTETSV